MNPGVFQDWFENRKNAIEKALAQWTPPEDCPPTALHGAMRHSLEAGGKRLRPVLLCATAEAFAPVADPLPAAAAVECLHTYTLIHDDLPAMDNSDLRRGRLTCHKAFGEAAAVLAGDALLSLSFQILAEAYSDHSVLANQLVTDLAIASGSHWLVGGQMDDILNEDKPIDADTLTSINRRKTGALIATSCVMGARIGGAEASQIETIREFGQSLGEAFQVIDDILDATATEQETGKSAGLDSANQKTTLVTLQGLQSTREKATALSDKAQALLSRSGARTKHLSHLVSAMLQRSR